MKRNYFYLLLALCIGAVVMSCRPTNEPEKPDRPHLGDTKINTDSPVGTVGVLDGREAMVVDLGGSIGKVAIATMNVGATSTTDGAGSETTAPCYGDYLSFDEAVSMSNYELWGIGWYLPSHEELEALMSHLKKRNGYSYYQWAVTKSSILYFPLAGHYDYDGVAVYMGNVGYYLSSTAAESDERFWELSLNMSYPEMWQQFKTAKSSVRLFHKLPAPNEITTESPVGTIGMIDGREGIVVDFGDTIGRVIIATMNVGATSTTDGAGSETTAPCYGDYLSYDDAKSLSNDQAWGEGWYVPSHKELEVLMSHLKKRDGDSYYQWAVTKSSILYFPLAGHYDYDGVAVYMGNVGYYLSSTAAESDERFWELSLNMSYPEMWQQFKTAKSSVRLFHSLPVPANAVDLGLPSGTMWAAMNLGAVTIAGWGDQYAWGEIETKDEYSWATYKWCDGNDNSITKYCTNPDWGKVDNKTVLDPEDDIAHVRLGDNWRMPYASEWQELVDNCSLQYSRLTVEGNDAFGFMVTGKNGNSIFLCDQFDPSVGMTYASKSLDLSDNRFHAGPQKNGPYELNVNFLSRSQRRSIRPILTYKVQPGKQN